jgi:hypothetical protein
MEEELQLWLRELCEVRGVLESRFLGLVHCEWALSSLVGVNRPVYVYCDLLFLFSRG